MASGGPRSGAGRKRKDPALKALSGSRRRSAPALPPADAAGGAMICPLHLSDLAKLLFGSIAKLLEEQNRASTQYGEHVALLAQRLEQIQRWQSVLEIEGDTYTSRTVKKVDGEAVVTEMIRARPEVAMLSDAMRQAQSLLGELMLNPSAALRLASGHKPEPGAFDDL